MAMEPMPQAAPKGAPAPEAEAPGGASQLVVDIQSKLQDLMSIVQKGAPEEAGKLGAIMDSYMNWVETGLGSAPGSPPPEAAGPKGPMPPEMGAKKAMPVL